MTNHAKDIFLNKMARIAGLAFLIIVTGYTLTWVFVYDKLIVAGNATATANNIIANELLFRIGIASDLMIAISTLVLAWALYIILKPINKNFALLALYLRLIESILATITVSFSFITLQVSSGKGYLTIFKPEQLRDIAGIFLNLHTAASTIPMVFTGLGSIVFFYLLFNSKYVPRVLAGFGVFSYVSILTYVFVKILVAQSATNLLGTIELICYLPSVLFEIMIGLWLLFRGANIPQQENISPESA